ncbi:Glycoside hydrolase family 43 protein [Mycena venus]|uniref:Glycoside hydrolase family 43 protein n=1 Tax=Mycena venus TaxID=2733690 RepID=A0A8H6YD75_9AGAR|nr:Glycoside hydrolase family 43 protein [Mycena venus]
MLKIFILFFVIASQAFSAIGFFIPVKTPNGSDPFVVGKLSSGSLGETSLTVCYHLRFSTRYANGSDKVLAETTDAARIVISNRDVWSIDPTVLIFGGNEYVVYSSSDGANQCLFIAQFTSATTVENAVKISTPMDSWETIGAPVDEGPAVLYHGGFTWIIFSASSCAGTGYQLGQLQLAGTNPLSASSWTEYVNLVFTSEKWVRLGVSCKFWRRLLIQHVVEISRYARLPIGGCCCVRLKYILAGPQWVLPESLGCPNLDRTCLRLPWVCRPFKGRRSSTHPRPPPGCVTAVVTPWCNSAFSCPLRYEANRRSAEVGWHSDGSPNFGSPRALTDSIPEPV